MLNACRDIKNAEFEATAPVLHWTCADQDPTILLQALVQKLTPGAFTAFAACCIAGPIQPAEGTAWPLRCRGDDSQYESFNEYDMEEVFKASSLRFHEIPKSTQRIQSDGAK